MTQISINVTYLLCAMVEVWDSWQPSYLPCSYIKSCFDSVGYMYERLLWFSGECLSALLVYEKYLLRFIKMNELNVIDLTIDPTHCSPAH